MLIGKANKKVQKVKNHDLYSRAPCERKCTAQGCTPTSPTSAAKQ